MQKNKFEIGDIIVRKNQCTPIKMEVRDVSEEYYILAYAGKPRQPLQARKISVVDEDYQIEYTKERSKKYYYVADGGRIGEATDRGTTEDEYRYSVGNYYKEYNEADFAERVALAKQKLIEDARGFDPDFHNKSLVKYRVVYNSSQGIYPVPVYGQKDPFVIYFEDKATARTSINRHLAEWKLVLGVSVWG